MVSLSSITVEINMMAMIQPSKQINKSSSKRPPSPTAL